ncbi:sugar ABC transporter [Roseomonas gilardii]|uniref:sugar ABC transporter n=1 Tax=Roseomonas gilardii TaxID=257708 RepID=UPI0011A03585|nr:sugar ABC transporter [Roseomonas gilardii]
MIYTVECSFADPVSEAEWNDFYSFDKLPALISVSGFHTSQRFKALRGGCPVYLALHTIDGLDILTGEEYRQKGGGNFARWQQHITNWHRNLYDGLYQAPAIGEGEILLLSSTGPDPLVRLGLDPRAMRAVELEKFPEHRWLARSHHDGLPVLDDLPEDIHVYAPMTAQLTSASGIVSRPQGVS